MTDKRITREIIFASDKRGAIGRHGRIPWRLKADMRMFRRMTMGSPLICGFNTWDGLPAKQLKGRKMIVLTRKPNIEELRLAYIDKEIVFTDSMDKAIMLAEAFSETGKMFCIGGADVYRQFEPHCDVIHWTRVGDHVSDPDAFFEPDIDEYELTSDVMLAQDERDTVLGRYMMLTRRG